jgi:hypothetical protein
MSELFKALELDIAKVEQVEKKCTDLLESVGLSDMVSSYINTVRNKVWKDCIDEPMTDRLLIWDLLAVAKETIEYYKPEWLCQFDYGTGDIWLEEHTVRYPWQTYVNSEVLKELQKSDWNGISEELAEKMEEIYILAWDVLDEYGYSEHDIEQILRKGFNLAGYGTWEGWNAAGRPDADVLQQRVSFMLFREMTERLVLEKGVHEVRFDTEKFEVVG